MANEIVLEPIVTESAIRRKGVIWRKLNFTYLDLLVLILISALGIGVAALTFKFNRFIGMFVIVVTISLLILLLRPLPKFRMKTYEVMIKILIHTLTPKKFKFGSKADTKILIPYKSIEGDAILMEDNNLLKMIEVIGTNFHNKEISAQYNDIEALRNVMLKLPYNASIIKMERARINRINLYHLEELKDHWTKIYNKGDINAQQYYSRIYQINAQINDFHNLEFIKENGYSSLKHGFFISYHDPEKNQLRSITEELKEGLTECGLLFHELTVNETVDVLKNIYDLEAIKLEEKEIDKHKNNIKDLIAPDIMNFKMNHIDLGTKKIAINAVYDFPFKLEYGWLSFLINGDQTIIMNVSSVSAEDYQQELHKAKRNYEDKHKSAKNHEEFVRKDIEKKMDEISNLEEVVGKNYDELKRMNVLVIHHGVTLADIKQSKREFNRTLKNNGMKSHELIFQQFEGLSAAMPKRIDPLNEVTAREVIGFTLGASFPFVISDLEDEHGQFLGHSTESEEIWFDSHKRTREGRSNDNMVLIGESGSGKTTVLTKMINYEIMNKTYGYIVDVEGAFTKVAKYFGENIIDMGSGNGTKINILQPMISAADLSETLSDLDKDIFGLMDISTKNDVDSDNDLIASHQGILTSIFEHLFNDLDEKDIRFVKKQFTLMFEWWKRKSLNKNKIINWQNEDFPTIDNWVDYLTSNEGKSKIAEPEKESYNKFLKILVDEFGQYGLYNRYFNGHTTISFNNKFWTVFDVSTLMEMHDDKLKNVQMLLITSIIEKKLRITQQLNPDHRQRIIWDEAHVFLDENFPISINLIFQISKRCRKRNAGATVATQSWQDFFMGNSKKAQAILENSQYQMTLTIKPKSIEKWEEEMGDSIGWTARERKFIGNDGLGKGMFQVQRNRRYLMYFLLSAAEEETINFDVKNLSKYVNYQMSKNIFTILKRDKYIDNSNANPIIIDEQEINIYFKNDTEITIINEMISKLKNQGVVENVKWEGGIMTIMINEKFKTLTRDFGVYVYKKMEIK